MKNVTMALMLVLLSVSSLALATTEKVAPPVKANPSWLGTMEASLVTSRMPNAEAWLGDTGVEKEPHWLSWMGWIVAAACLLVLGTLHLRSRRQQKTLLRGGEPDFFFLPPARDRRRRPR